jgi:F420-dependent oxidoreductase-like protein
MRDHATVRDDHHLLVGMRGHDPLERSPNSSVELLERLGAGNDVPAFLAEDLHEHGIFGDGAFAKEATFPLAEEDLAEIRLLDGRDPQPLRERRRGLVRAAQCGDVDRVDLLALEPVGEKLRLANTCGMQFGIAVPVSELERPARHLGRRFAVADDEDGRRAGRGREPVLAYALFLGRAHPPRLRCEPMKLGYMIGYWGAGPPAGVPEALAEAERLGFDSCWTAEAYGSDALTPLAWWGAATERIKLGTSICQLSARTPTAMAMAALTLDHLSGGRFVLGLGASGPQVAEGWYGDDYRRPLARTREYVEIVRQVLAREKPVEFHGERYQLPNPHGTGLGKPLKSIVHPLRAELPVYLAAEGPKNVALAAEIADGWLPMFYAPRSDGFYRDALAEGFSRPGARRKADEFEVACHVPIIIGDDVEAAAAFYRPALALYIGGMGAREVNFHNDVFARMGYLDEAKHIQDLYLEGKKDEAAAAVPLQLVEDVALVGPKEKIRDDLEQWRESTVTTMIVSGPPQQLGMIADLILG